MNIPDDLKIYSFIYEYFNWVFLPLTALWIAGGIYLIIRVKKVFFLWLLIFPLILSPLRIACVYSGWHYRMELRERFARTDRGFSDSYTSKAINIDLMPPAIRAEYAKHDYHPRFRDMIALAVGTIVLTPLLYAFGGLAYSISILLHNIFEKPRKKVEQSKD